MDHGIAIAGYAASHIIEDRKVPDPDAYYAEYGIDYLAAPKRAVLALRQRLSVFSASINHFRAPRVRLTSGG